MHKDVLDINNFFHPSLCTSKVKDGFPLHKIHIGRREAKSLRDSEDAKVAKHEHGRNHIFV